MTKSRSDTKRVDALLDRLNQYQTDNSFLKERIQQLESELRHERRTAHEAVRRGR